MKTGLKPATKAESRRMEIIKNSVGCIATRIKYGVYAPCEIHHLLDTGRRRGHAFTIGLTYANHQGPNGIHRAKRRFQEEYATDDELLAETNWLIEAIESNVIGGRG